jgi:hypothetical protein
MDVFKVILICTIIFLIYKILSYNEKKGKDIIEGLCSAPDTDPSASDADVAAAAALTVETDCTAAANVWTPDTVSVPATTPQVPDTSTQNLPYQIWQLPGKVDASGNRPMIEFRNIRPWPENSVADLQTRGDDLNGGLRDTRMVDGVEVPAIVNPVPFIDKFELELPAGAGGLTGAELQADYAQQCYQKVMDYNDTGEPLGVAVAFRIHSYTENPLIPGLGAEPNTKVSTCEIFSKQEDHPTKTNNLTDWTKKYPIITPQSDPSPEDAELHNLYPSIGHQGEGNWWSTNKWWDFTGSRDRASAKSRSRARTHRTDSGRSLSFQTGPRQTLRNQYTAFIGKVHQNQLNTEGGGGGATINDMSIGLSGTDGPLNYPKISGVDAAGTDVQIDDKTWERPAFDANGVAVTNQSEYDRIKKPPNFGLTYATFMVGMDTGPHYTLQPMTIPDYNPRMGEMVPIIDEWDTQSGFNCGLSISVSGSQNGGYGDERDFGCRDGAQPIGGRWTDHTTAELEADLRIDSSVEGERDGLEKQDGKPIIGGLGGKHVSQLIVPSYWDTTFSEDARDGGKYSGAKQIYTVSDPCGEMWYDPPGEAKARDVHMDGPSKYKNLRLSGNRTGRLEAVSAKYMSENPSDDWSIPQGSNGRCEGCAWIHDWRYGRALPTTSTWDDVPGDVLYRGTNIGWSTVRMGIADEPTGYTRTTPSSTTWAQAVTRTPLRSAATPRQATNIARRRAGITGLKALGVSSGRNTFPLIRAPADQHQTMYPTTWLNGVTDNLPNHSCRPKGNAIHWTGSGALAPVAVDNGAGGDLTGSDTLDPFNKCYLGHSRCRCKKMAGARPPGQGVYDPNKCYVDTEYCGGGTPGANDPNSIVECNRVGFDVGENMAPSVKKYEKWKVIDRDGEDLEIKNLIPMEFAGESNLSTEKYDKLHKGKMLHFSQLDMAPAHLISYRRDKSYEENPEIEGKRSDLQEYYAEECSKIARSIDGAGSFSVTNYEKNKLFNVQDGTGMCFNADSDKDGSRYSSGTGGAASEGGRNATHNGAIGQPMSYGAGPDRTCQVIPMIRGLINNGQVDKTTKTFASSQKQFCGKIGRVEEGGINEGYLPGEQIGDPGHPLPGGALNEDNMSEDIKDQRGTPGKVWCAAIDRTTGINSFLGTAWTPTRRATTRSSATAGNESRGCGPMNPAIQGRASRGMKAPDNSCAFPNQPVGSPSYNSINRNSEHDLPDMTGQGAKKPPHTGPLRVAATPSWNDGDVDAIQTHQVDAHIQAGYDNYWGYNLRKTQNIINDIKFSGSGVEDITIQSLTGGESQNPILGKFGHIDSNGRDTRGWNDQRRGVVEAGVTPYSASPRLPLSNVAIQESEWASHDPTDANWWDGSISHKPYNLVAPTKATPVNIEQISEGESYAAEVGRGGAGIGNPYDIIHGSDPFISNAGKEKFGPKGPVCKVYSDKLNDVLDKYPIPASLGSATATLAGDEYGNTVGTPGLLVDDNDPDGGYQPNTGDETYLSLTINEDEEKRLGSSGNTKDNWIKHRQRHRGVEGKHNLNNIPGTRVPAGWSKDNRLKAFAGLATGQFGNAKLTDLYSEKALDTNTTGEYINQSPAIWTDEQLYRFVPASTPTPSGGETQEDDICGNKWYKDPVPPEQHGCQGLVTTWDPAILTANFIGDAPPPIASLQNPFSSADCSIINNIQKDDSPGSRTAREWCEIHSAGNNTGTGSCVWNSPEITDSSGIGDGTLTGNSEMFGPSNNKYLTKGGGIIESSVEGLKCNGCYKPDVSLLPGSVRQRYDMDRDGVSDSCMVDSRCDKSLTNEYQFTQCNQTGNLHSLTHEKWTINYQGDDVVVDGIFNYAKNLPFYERENEDNNTDEPPAAMAKNHDGLERCRAPIMRHSRKLFKYGAAAGGGVSDIVADGQMEVPYNHYARTNNADGTTHNVERGAFSCVPHGLMDTAPSWPLNETNPDQEGSIPSQALSENNSITGIGSKRSTPYIPGSARQTYADGLTVDNGPLPDDQNPDPHKVNPAFPAKVIAEIELPLRKERKKLTAEELETKYAEDCANYANNLTINTMADHTAGFLVTSAPRFYWTSGHYWDAEEDKRMSNLRTFETDPVKSEGGDYRQASAIDIEWRRGVHSGGKGYLHDRMVKCHIINDLPIVNLEPSPDKPADSSIYRFHRLYDTTTMDQQNRCSAVGLGTSCDDADITRLADQKIRLGLPDTTPVADVNAAETLRRTLKPQLILQNPGLDVPGMLSTCTGPGTCATDFATALSTGLGNGISEFDQCTSPDNTPSGCTFAPPTTVITQTQVDTANNSFITDTARTTINQYIDDVQGIVDDLNVQRQTAINNWRSTGEQTTAFMTAFPSDARDNSFTCSDNQYPDESSCVTAGENWTEGFTNGDLIEGFTNGDLIEGFTNGDLIESFMNGDLIEGLCNSPTGSPEITLTTQPLCEAVAGHVWVPDENDLNQTIFQEVNTQWVAANDVMTTLQGSLNSLDAGNVDADSASVVQQNAMTAYDTINGANQSTQGINSQLTILRTQQMATVCDNIIAGLPVADTTSDMRGRLRSDCEMLMGSIKQRGEQMKNQCEEHGLFTPGSCNDSSGVITGAQGSVVNSSADCTTLGGTWTAPQLSDKCIQNPDGSINSLNQTIHDLSSFNRYNTNCDNPLSNNGERHRGKNCGTIGTLDVPTDFLKYTNEHDTLVGEFDEIDTKFEGIKVNENLRLNIYKRLYGMKNYTDGFNYPDDLQSHTVSQYINEIPDWLLTNKTDKITQKGQLDTSYNSSQSTLQSQLAENVTSEITNQIKQSQVTDLQARIQQLNANKTLLSDRPISCRTCRPCVKCNECMTLSSFKSVNECPGCPNCNDEVNQAIRTKTNVCENTKSSLLNSMDKDLHTGTVLYQTTDETDSKLAVTRRQRILSLASERNCQSNKAITNVSKVDLLNDIRKFQLKNEELKEKIEWEKKISWLDKLKGITKVFKPSRSYKFEAINVNEMDQLSSR